MTYEIDPTIDPATNRPRPQLATGGIIRNPIRLSPPAEQQHSQLTRQTATPEPADFTLPTSAALRRQLARAEAERDQARGDADNQRATVARLRHELLQAAVARDKATADNLDLAERLALAAVDRDESRRQADELQALFDLQYTRTTDAEKRWRAEDPEARGHIAPDLGRLLAWLMADADRAKRQRDSLARRLAIRFEETQKARAELAEVSSVLDALIPLSQKYRRQTDAAYAFAAEMAGYCSPHGVSADYAMRLTRRLDDAVHNTADENRTTLTDGAKEYLDTTRSASTEAGSVPRVAQETHGSAHIDCVKCGSPNVAPQVQELRDA